MTKIEPPSAVMKYFGYRMAIIQVKSEESNEDAWERHLMEAPDDINATIRIFNI